ncbi:hypothetical protein D3C72_1901970 [compost metagenome]
MRPVFEQSSLAARSPGQPVQISAIIAAQPREGRQVMGARQDVDAVDLMQVQAIDGAPEMHRRRSLWPPRAEALGGERHPARLRQADGLHAHGHPARLQQPSSSPGARSGQAFNPIAVGAESVHRDHGLDAPSLRGSANVDHPVHGVTDHL